MSVLFVSVLFQCACAQPTFFSVSVLLMGAYFAPFSAIVEKKAPIKSAHEMQRNPDEIWHSWALSANGRLKFRLSSGLSDRSNGGKAKTIDDAFLWLAVLLFSSPFFEPIRYCCMLGKTKRKNTSFPTLRWCRQLLINLFQTPFVFSPAERKIMWKVLIFELDLPILC